MAENKTYWRNYKPRRFHLKWGGFISPFSLFGMPNNQSLDECDIYRALMSPFRWLINTKSETDGGKASVLTSGWINSIMEEQSINTTSDTKYLTLAKQIQYKRIYPFKHDKNESIISGSYTGLQVSNNSELEPFNSHWKTDIARSPQGSPEVWLTGEWLEGTCVDVSWLWRGPSSSPAWCFYKWATSPWEH